MNNPGSDKPVYLGDLVSELDNGFGDGIVRVHYQGSETFDVPSSRYYELQYTAVGAWEAFREANGDRVLLVK